MPCQTRSSQTGSHLPRPGENRTPKQSKSIRGHEAESSEAHRILGPSAMPILRDAPSLLDNRQCPKRGATAVLYVKLYVKQSISKQASQVQETKVRKGSSVWFKNEWRRQGSRRCFGHL